MLTKLIIRNFKRFDEVEIELGNPVVLVGPNNSGKTTALQALALWDIGLRRWLEKHIRKRGAAGTVRQPPKERPGVTINRRDLIAVPVPDANLLWRNLHVRDIRRVNGGQETQNVRVDIIVEGVTGGTAWKCGLEFDFANQESFYCRPLRVNDGDPPERMPVPENMETHVAFLPPMSGLADREFYKQTGEIGFLIGQGRTAEVLRNLCYQIYSAQNGSSAWLRVVQRIEKLFGVKLDDPEFLVERSEIVMTYRDQNAVRLDLSSSGRGLQQTLLLLAYLTANPNSVLLLDEPDAHLEILRQRQIYQILTEVAREQDSQIIAASHSEVVLNEAADRDVVVAFVGKPHRIDDRGSQLLKALKDIGFEDYYQAEQTGWILYLEGATDLAILQAFAKIADHPVSSVLEQPFVHYILSNQAQKARDHYYGILEAKPDLVGFALFDRLDRTLKGDTKLVERMWAKKEIENYLCQKDILLAWAEGEASQHELGPLFVQPWVDAMQASISEIEQALRTLGKDPWSPDTKASEEFLTPLFRAFFEKLKLPNLMNKSNFHELARYMPQNQLDPEIYEVLDAILAVSRNAHPASE